MYRYDHNKEISTSALAAMLSVTLYYKRFFPYYASCMVVGLDDEGKDCRNFNDELKIFSTYLLIVIVFLQLSPLNFFIRKHMWGIYDFFTKSFAGFE